jgi:threonine/homoserine/homoserine lactone efflux protein
MTPELLMALVAFAFVTSITPGPNNLMLMASGAAFGFRRTVPHMLGVGIGFMLMAVLVGLGLAGLIEAEPRLKLALKAVGVAYMLWFAWQILNAGAPREAGAAARPMRFHEAALFQWVNPKAWAMALTAVTAYAPEQTVPAVLAVAVIFGLVNIPSVGSWTLLGQQMRRWLTSDRRRRVFNAAMALLLVASLWPLIAT